MNYINIRPDCLNIDEKYNFFIFLYEPHSSTRSVALDYLSLLTQEKLDELISFHEKQANIQILDSDIEEFITHTESDFEQLREDNLIYFKCREILDAREESIFLEEEFSFKLTLHECIESDDFLPLITRVHDEILSLDLSLSQEISNTSDLIEKTFQKDYTASREASFVYFYAKYLKIKDPQILCDMIIASLIKDLGEFLLPRGDSLYADIKSDNYEKHPMLTIYFLSKTNFKSSKNTSRFILEHHESADGEGFPRSKRQEQIEMSSFIISLAHEIFNYNKHNNENKNLKEIIRIYANQNLSAQGRIRFPESLTDPLKLLLKVD